MTIGERAEELYEEVTESGRLGFDMPVVVYRLCRVIAELEARAPTGAPSAERVKAS